MGFAPAQGNSSGGSGTIIVDPGDGTANVLSKFGLLSGTTIELFDSNVSDDGSTVTVDSDFEVTGLSSFDDVVTVNSSLIANEYIGQDDTELDISIGNISSGAGLNIVFSAGPAAGINNLQGGDFKFNPGLPTGAGARGKLKVLDGGTQKSIGLWHDGTNSHIENSAGQIQMGGPANTAATGTVLIQGNIADNPALVVEDSGNSGGGSNGIFKVINSVGTNIFAVSNFGYLYMGNTGGSETFEINPTNAGVGLNLNSSTPILWNSNTTLNGSNDVGLMRAAASVTKMTNGSTGGGTFSAVATSPAAITSGSVSNDNYNPGGTSYQQRWSASTISGNELTGMTFTATQVDGQVHEIINVGNYGLVLKNQNSHSSSANRFLTRTGNDARIAPKEMTKIVYDGTSTAWRIAQPSFTSAITTITGSFSPFLMNVDTHDVLLVNATSSNVTVTLPPAADKIGKMFHFKKTDATGNVVTVTGNASENIDVANTRAITTQYEAISIVSDGSNWFII